MGLDLSGFYRGLEDSRSQQEQMWKNVGYLAAEGMDKAGDKRQEALLKGERPGLLGWGIAPKLFGSKARKIDAPINMQELGRMNLKQLGGEVLAGDREELEKFESRMRESLGVAEDDKDWDFNKVSVSDLPLEEQETLMKNYLNKKYGGGKVTGPGSTTGSWKQDEYGNYYKDIEAQKGKIGYGDKQWAPGKMIGKGIGGLAKFAVKGAQTVLPGGERGFARPLLEEFEAVGQHKDIVSQNAQALSTVGVTEPETLKSTMEQQGLNPNNQRHLERFVNQASENEAKVSKNRGNLLNYATENLPAHYGLNNEKGINTYMKNIGLDSNNPKDYKEAQRYLKSAAKQYSRGIKTRAKLNKKQIKEQRKIEQKAKREAERKEREVHRQAQKGKREAFRKGLIEKASKGIGKGLAAAGSGIRELGRETGYTTRTNRLSHVQRKAESTRVNMAVDSFKRMTQIGATSSNVNQLSSMNKTNPNEFYTALDRMPKKDLKKFYKTHLSKLPRAQRFEILRRYPQLHKKYESEHTIGGLLGARFGK